jgi:DNA-binding transcriptional regulator of glucitol operon
LDSIPLFAIFFKLLSPFLVKDHFQYIGLWNLVSLTGQMLVGMLILGEFTHSYINKILGASLLVLSPPMLYRAFYHDALTAQWILLAAIWFIILEYRQKFWHYAWIFLFTLAMLVHIYFVAMLLPLWAIALFFHYSKQNKKWMLILDIFILAGVLLLVGFSIGLFSLPLNNLSIGGYAFYSWNLNGFFNPLSYSFFIKEMQLGTPDNMRASAIWVWVTSLFCQPDYFSFFKKITVGVLFSFFYPLELSPSCWDYLRLPSKLFWDSIICGLFMFQRFC